MAGFQRGILFLLLFLAPGVAVWGNPTPQAGLDFLPRDIFSLTEGTGPEATDPAPERRILSPVGEKADRLWTILFYDDGDIVGGDPIAAIIEEFFSTETTDVVVLDDLAEGPATLYHIPTQYNYTILEEWGEVDMGDAATLERFIAYGKTNYPAQRYLVCAYDHGGHFYGVCWDEHTPSGEPNNLTWTDLRNAIAATGGVDLLAFLAPCVVTPLEGMVELGDTVDVVVGSEDGSYYRIWYGVMGDVCSLLATTPEITTEAVATRMVQWAAANTEYFFDDMTADAVDPGATAAIATALDDLARYLAINMDDLQETLMQVRTDCWQIFSNYMEDYYAVDLVSWLETLAAAIPDQTVQDLIAAVVAAHEAAVIAIGHGPLQDQAHGISIYFPATEEERLTTYREFGLSMIADTVWDEFLLSYFAGECLPAQQTGSLGGIKALFR